MFLNFEIRINPQIKGLFLAKNLKARWFFSRLKLGEFAHHPKIVYINNVACYLSASVIKSKTGQPEFQFLISFDNPSESQECYKKRWQIDHAVAPKVNDVQSTKIKRI